METEDQPQIILNPDYLSDYLSVSYYYDQSYWRMRADASNSSLDYCDGLVVNYNDTYHHSVVTKLTDPGYAALLEKSESNDKYSNFSGGYTEH